MPSIVTRILTYGIVYGVSATFFFPLGIIYLFGYLYNHVGGGLFGAGVTLFVASVYAYLNYGGRPERRTGRIWLALNKRWTISHWYFPVSLKVWDGTKCTQTPSASHKTALPKCFILALHPHGPFPVSASILMPQLARFGETLGDLFSNVRFAASSAVFWLPGVREMYLWLGCVEAGRRTLTTCLDTGHSVAILPGGEDEQLMVCLESSPYEDLVVPRDGLFRLALTTGTPIIPSFAFGERRLYESSNFMLKIRLNWVKKHRIGIPVAWGKHKIFPFVPRGFPITIVMGKPIPLLKSSSGDDTANIEKCRRDYMTAVEELFEAHKGCDEVARHKKIRWVARPNSGKAE